MSRIPHTISTNPHFYNIVHNISHSCTFSKLFKMTFLSRLINNTCYYNCVMKPCGVSASRWQPSKIRHDGEMKYQDTYQNPYDKFEYLLRLSTHL